MPWDNAHNTASSLGVIVSALLAVALLLALLGGCASRQVVVLLPDRDGHVGKAEVATQGGTQLLETAGGMTVVSGRSTPPSPPTVADPGYIAATFAGALAVEPLPSVKFILNYDPESTDPVGESKTLIPAILAAIKQRNAVSISISGHTDAVGTVPYNDKLAQDRALAIRDLLIHNGVDPQRLTVSSHGKGNPLVPTPDGVPEPRNRRVEVIVR